MLLIFLCLFMLLAGAGLEARYDIVAKYVYGYKVKRETQ